MRLWKSLRRLRAALATSNAKHQQHSPPRAARRPVVKSKHGIVWEDPYDWLRHARDAEVRGYLSAENRYAEWFMSRTLELQRQLEQEMRSYIPPASSSVPEAWGDWLYCTQTPPGKEYPAYLRWRKSVVAAQNKLAAAAVKLLGREPKVEVLLDMNQLVDEYGYAQLGALKPSRDHQLLAYTLDLEGNERFTLFVKDLVSGEQLFSREGVVSVEWSGVGNSIYFTSSNESLRPCRVHFYKLETAEERILLEDDNAKNFVDVTRTKDWHYILINVNSKITSEIPPRHRSTCTESNREEKACNILWNIIKDGFTFLPIVSATAKFLNPIV